MASPAPAGPAPPPFQIHGGLSRLRAGDMGRAGIRVDCVRPHAIPPELARGCHAGEVFRAIAVRAGITVEAMLGQAAAAGMLLKRFPTPEEVAETAAFLASD